MWHHKPMHVFEPDVFYMMTAGTLHKEHFYQGSDRLELLQTGLQDILAEGFAGVSGISQSLPFRRASAYRRIIAQPSDPETAPRHCPRDQPQGSHLRAAYGFSSGTLA